MSDGMDVSSALTAVKTDYSQDLRDAYLLYDDTSQTVC